MTAPELRAGAPSSRRRAGRGVRGRPRPPCGGGVFPPSAAPRRSRRPAHFATRSSPPSGCSPLHLSFMTCPFSLANLPSCVTPKGMATDSASEPRQHPETRVRSSFAAPTLLLQVNRTQISGVVEVVVYAGCFFFFFSVQFYLLNSTSFYLYCELYIKRIMHYVILCLASFFKGISEVHPSCFYDLWPCIG